MIPGKINFRHICFLNKISCFCIMLLLIFGVSANTPSVERKPILVVNTNYKGPIDENVIKLGKVFILVKPNPSKLTNEQMVLQTGKYNIYATSGWEDLQSTQKFRKLMAAKFNKDGTVKVYTLPNIGYPNVQSDPVHIKEVWLMNNRGGKIKVQEFTLPMVPQPIYNEKINTNLRINNR